MTKSRVAGKVAWVTGAGSGIGRATALLLGQEGAKVAVTDIDKKKSHRNCIRTASTRMPNLVV